MDTIRKTEDIDHHRRRLLTTAAMSIAAAGATTLLPSPLVAEPAAEVIRPFRVNVPEEQLVDLRRRVAATRWSETMHRARQSSFKVQENAMTTQLKRQIAFALSIGLVTTGIISFVILALNLGFPRGFAMAWIRSWGLGYMIVIPAILLIGPRLQARVDRLINWVGYGHLEAVTPDLFTSLRLYGGCFHDLPPFRQLRSYGRREILPRACHGL